VGEDAPTVTAFRSFLVLTSSTARAGVAASRVVSIATTTIVSLRIRWLLADSARGDHPRPADRMGHCGISITSPA
jgi:hypothetical protein